MPLSLFESIHEYLRELTPHYRDRKVIVTAVYKNKTLSGELMEINNDSIGILSDDEVQQIEIDKIQKFSYEYVGARVVF